MKITTVPIDHRIKHLQPIFTITKNDKYFVSGGVNGEMKLWDLDYTFIKTVKKHSGSLTCVRFSLDNKYLASSGDDGKIFIFDQDGQDVVKTIKHKSDVTHIEWTPDFLVSSDLDGEVIITKISDFTEFRKLKDHEDTILGMTFNPGFKYLCTFSESKIVLYQDFNIRSQKTIEKGVILENMNSKISFSPNSKFISVGLQFNKKLPTVDIFDLNLERVFSLVGHVAPSEITAFCPLAFKNIQKFYVLAVASQDLGVSIWTTLNPKPFLLLKNFTESPILDMFWDNLTLYVSSYDGLVKKIEFNEQEFGEKFFDDEIDQDFELPFSEKNIELQKNYEKRIERLDFNEKIEIIQATGFTINETPIEEILIEDPKVNQKIDIAQDSSIVPRPKRIAPVMVEKKKTVPLINKKSTCSVVLYDISLPDKIKMIKTGPFKKKFDDYTVELKESGDICVKRATRPFYMINGPCNKVCFNQKFLVIYTTHIQIYDLTTGILQLPFICVKLAYLDILDDQVLLLDTYGSFTVLDVVKLKSISDKLPKTKNLTKIQLSRTHFLVAEYNDEEVVFYHKKMKVWLSVNPNFNSITSEGVDFYNDNDDTMAELELSFVHYALLKDVKNMKAILKQFLLLIRRIKSFEEFVEYKFENMLDKIEDKKFIELILEEMNREAFFQRFVVKMCRKYEIK